MPLKGRSSTHLKTCKNKDCEKHFHTPYRHPNLCPECKEKKKTEVSERARIRQLLRQP